MSWGKDAWIFQRSIAEKLGCSVRTVQRWLREFRDLGLLKCFRCKKGERPPKMPHPIWCGWSHRVLTAWHSAGTRFRELCEEIRLRREAKRAARVRGQGMSAEQIDRELLRRFGPAP
jgi:DNA-binding Lrp family transcriptional regulator